MNYSIRTIGFGMIQVAATTVIAFWIAVSHSRFKFEHPDGQGPVIANLCWDYSWWYLTVVAFLLIWLAIAARKQRSVIYSLVTFLGYTLLILWFGFAMVSMEMCYVPAVCLHGVHY